MLKFTVFLIIDIACKLKDWSHLVKFFNAKLLSSWWTAKMQFPTASVIRATATTTM